jgi:hypothetical protein
MPGQGSRPARNSFSKLSRISALIVRGRYPAARSSPALRGSSTGALVTLKTLARLPQAPPALSQSPTHPYTGTEPGRTPPTRRLVASAELTHRQPIRSPPIPAGAGAVPGSTRRCRRDFPDRPAASPSTSRLDPPGWSTTRLDQPVPARLPGPTGRFAVDFPDRPAGVGPVLGSTRRNHAGDFGTGRRGLAPGLSRVVPVGPVAVGDGCRGWRSADWWRWAGTAGVRVT